jgi:hypothetical protein
MWTNERFALAYQIDVFCCGNAALAGVPTFGHPQVTAA